MGAFFTSAGARKRSASGSGKWSGVRGGKTSSLCFRPRDWRDHTGVDVYETLLDSPSRLDVLGRLLGFDVSAKRVMVATPLKSSNTFPKLSRRLHELRSPPALA